MLINLEKISKTYAGTNHAALREVSLQVAEGEFVAIIGPSGCGKSTLLKIIAKLEAADHGTVEVPEKLSMVFQSGALLPWLTVADNVAFGLHGKPQTTTKPLVKKYGDPGNPIVAISAIVSGIHRPGTLDVTPIFHPFCIECSEPEVE